LPAGYIPPGQAPTREQVDRMPGPVLLEFGTAWCGHCRAIAHRVDALLATHPGVRHVKVEDGPGQPLGRSFKVRLWPNFVFLRDGTLLRQLARPTGEELRQAFEAFGADPGAARQG
jgi:thioredoxin 1